MMMRMPLSLDGSAQRRPAECMKRWEGQVTVSTPPGGGPQHGAGTVLARRYRLVRELGSGQFATVHLAEDLRLGNRHVAVKIGHPEVTAETPRPIRDHLLQEARVLAGMHHPAVPYLMDVLLQDEAVALVMEYLPGRTLYEATAGIPAPEEDVLEWVMRLCDVLIHMYGRPQAYAHRAISMDNAMLLPTGRLVLIDFGTALPATDVTFQQETYALILLLYHLLTGTEHRKGPFPAVRTYAPSVSEMTDLALHTALHRADTRVPLSLGTLRRLLLECRNNLGMGSGICPYCLATTRAQARHCGACGSPVPAVLTLPSAASPAAAPDSAASQHWVASSLDVRRARSTAVPGQSVLLRGPRGLYRWRLRAVGYTIDQHEMQRVTIEEDSEGFSIQGQKQAPRQSGSLLINSERHERLQLHVSHDELQAINNRSLQQRYQPPTSAFVHPGGAWQRSAFFPTGYEDGLRALGYQLDVRGGISHLQISEDLTRLALDYDAAGDTATGSLARHHLELSVADMEEVLATAVERRGSGHEQGVPVDVPDLPTATDQSTS